MLLKKEVREKHNPFLAWINRKSIGIFDWCHARKKRTITFATLVAAVGIWCFTLLGSEFLPQLNEGSIYIRATLPQSISLDESVTLANQMRRKLAAYPEVRQVLSQTAGRTMARTRQVSTTSSSMWIYIPRKSGKANARKRA